MLDDENATNPQYYFQDELGSPIRLFDETGTFTDTYGYDEFGQDLYHNQGTIQPFGYTGYQQDAVAGTYYAQAREYRSEIGRFIEADLIAGYIQSPLTLNRYNYCLAQPLLYVDKNGMSPKKTYTLEHRQDINGIGLKWDESGTRGTIILGNDATDEDAFTIITLDRMKDLGYNSKDINKFIDNYRKKQKNDTLIEEGKSIDYYTNFEDITKPLTGQMIKNEYEYSDGMAPLTWIFRLKEFQNNVQNKGPWDLKQQAAWGNSSLYIFNGKIVDRDAPGNIMYGYMGKVYGIPDNVLSLGASYAQLKAGTSKMEWLFITLGDDPMDQRNILRCIEFFDTLHTNADEIEWGCDYG